MKLFVKLTAVVLVPSIALVGFGGYQVHEKWQAAQSMEQIESLSELAVDISSLVHETQKERGRTAGFLGSNGKKFANELASQRAQTDQRIKALRSSLQSLDRSSTDESLLSLIDSAISRLDDVPAIRRQVSSLEITTPEAIGHYTKMNADFLNAIGGIAKMSENSDLNTTLVAYSMFLKSKERAGIERAVLSAVFARDSFAPGENAKFISLVSQQNTYMNEFLQVASEQGVMAYEKAISDPSYANVQKMRDIALSKSAEGGFGIDAEDWFATISTKINNLKKIEDQLAEEVAQQAEEIRSAAATQMTVSAVIVASVLGVAFVFGTIIARSIARRVSRISQQIADAEESKDLTALLDTDGNDEITTMAESFNRFISSIHKLVAEVGSVSREVASAATEMAATSDQFANGLDNQSTQTSGAAAAIEELAASIRQISSQSSEASEAAQLSRKDAELGGQTVRDTVSEIQAIAHDVRDSSQAINELGKRSEHIGQIINVINDIADQTNLLALNAAIEAARAGEHGRGFAVVADEVRKLAERTSNATQEVTDAIRQIQTDTRDGMERIESSVARVDTGVEFATSAGEALERIVKSAQEVGVMVTGISSATEEQASASDDIARRIDALRAVADESKLAACQSAEASNNMSTQAERLRELVSIFKT